MDRGRDIPPAWAGRPWRPGVLEELVDVEWSPADARPVSRWRGLLEEQLGDLEGLVVADDLEHDACFRRPDPARMRITRGGELVGHLEIHRFERLRLRGTMPGGMRLEADVVGFVRWVPARHLLEVAAERSGRFPVAKLSPADAARLEGD